jgi:hypothetical protein
MTPPSANAADPRRKSVRRTVLWLAVAAFAVYAGFLVLGWLGMAGAK